VKLFQNLVNSRSIAQVCRCNKAKRISGVKYSRGQSVIQESRDSDLVEFLCMQGGNSAWRAHKEYGDD
jgi:hypothetical protein